MTCSACGAENRPGRKFCSSCGAGRSRAHARPAVRPTSRTTASAASAARRSRPDRRRARAVEAERRLVSVLFGDLVGFTPLSENRDPEEVRELLSRYFETARR